MVTRAVSATDWLTPPAVLIPILAMPAGTAWAITTVPAPGAPGLCET